MYVCLNKSYFKKIFDFRLVSNKFGKLMVRCLKKDSSKINFDISKKF